MPSLSSIVFEEVRGLIPPRATPAVSLIDNPGLTPAAVVLPTQPPVTRLTYRGFFTTSQKSAITALIGTVINAADETVSTVSVLLLGATITEMYAQDGATPGVWCECQAEVIAWA